MKYILIAWLAGCGSDATSTTYGLQHGGREIVLTQNNTVNTSIISSEAVVGAIGLKKLHETHPKLAVSIAVIAGVFKTSVAYHNVNVIRNGSR